MPTFRNLATDSTVEARQFDPAIDFPSSMAALDWCNAIDGRAGVAIPTLDGRALPVRPGDWIVKIGDGTFGVLAADVFTATHTLAVGGAG